MRSLEPAGVELARGKPSRPARSGGAPLSGAERLLAERSGYGRSDLYRQGAS
jgi:hypothetical protein